MGLVTRLRRLWHEWLWQHTRAGSAQWYSRLGMLRATVQQPPLSEVKQMTDLERYLARKAQQLEQEMNDPERYFLVLIFPGVEGPHSTDSAWVWEYPYDDAIFDTAIVKGRGNCFACGLALNIFNDIQAPFVVITNFIAPAAAKLLREGDVDRPLTGAERREIGRRIHPDGYDSEGELRALEAAMCAPARRGKSAL